MRVVLLAATAALALGGCELLQSGPGPTEVSGIVFSLSTGEPLAGLSVTLREGSGWGLYAIRNAVRTDAAGRFHLAYDTDRRGILDVHVNDEPWDPRYQNPWFSVRIGEHTERRVELYSYTRLTVVAEPVPPLEPGEQYIIHLPCVGGQGPITTTCARGNAMTAVIVTVHRDGVTETVVDSVYTPLGVETTFQMRF